MSLGPKVVPPAKPLGPEWVRVPGKPHLERNRDTDFLRTCPTLLPPKGHP